MIKSFCQATFLYCTSLFLHCATWNYFFFLHNKYSTRISNFSVWLGLVNKTLVLTVNKYQFIRNHGQTWTIDFAIYLIIKWQGKFRPLNHGIKYQSWKFDTSITFNCMTYVCTYSVVTKTFYIEHRRTAKITLFKLRITIIWLDGILKHLLNIFL